MQHAIGTIPFLLAMAALPAAGQLPASCGGVGAKSYTPPAFTIPPVVLNRGTVITVTNATGVVNGDTSSVKALMANPGPDGISLVEAITATNNDPGTWNIQFAPALKGSTILGGLPYLSGGNVTVNGDIDGDGQPDITVTSTIFVISGGNTVNGLAFQNGAYVGIQRPSAKFQLPAATGKTFSNITISNLVMTGIQNEGISLNPTIGEPGLEPSSPALATGNTWDHLLIVGNTISITASGPTLGIDLLIGGTVGDTLQHTTIANNHIVMQSPGGGGIQVIAGAGIGSTNNQVLDTLIANNVITATSIQSAIHVGTGIGSASKNSMNGLQIVGNQMHLTGPGQYPAEPQGIAIVGGDAASDDMNPPVLPIQYSENNTISNVSILSNTIQTSLSGAVAVGIAPFGINVQESCCGNRNNTLSGLSILGNTISGTLNVGVMLNSGSSGGYYSRTTTADVLSNVLIQANTIQMTPTVYNGCNCYPGTMGITFGGIQIWTGSEEPGNSVNGLSILNNEVDTPFVGISVIGGLGGGGALNAPISPADNNVVSGAQISCNQVDQAATLALAPYTGIKGINVVAGMLNASGNQVQQLSVANNLVGGVLNDVSLFAYLGSGGSGNSISLAGPSGTTNGPQTVAGTVVNAATFQQRALAPGSLVSVFGLNLNGATVQFNGVSAPILYASSSQLNLQVPWELQGTSTTSVTITGNSIGNEIQSVPVAPSDPGIFSLGAPQGGQGAIENVAGSVVDAISPAHAGDYILIFANGLGAVTNTPPTGAAAFESPLSIVTSMTYPTATIGGVAAFVSFAGLAPGFVGLYQVNVQVPQGVAAGDSVPVVLSTGSTLSNTVTISVR
jgi:uncharacterized protein (TIGR03437 family)